MLGWQGVGGPGTAACPLIYATLSFSLEKVLCALENLATEASA